MKKSVCIIAAIALAGCSAAYTRMSKSEMEIQTAMSSTIWLEPANPETTRILVQARNTSDNRGFDNIAQSVRHALMDKGYIITQNPDEARFVLQVNVLKAVMVSDRINPNQAGSESLVAGVGTGMAVGSRNNMATAIGAGLIAGLGTMMFDANTKDNYYAVQTDIRISDKAGGAHTTKMTVMANKVNLTPAEATPPIKDAIANSLANLF